MNSKSQIVNQFIINEFSIKEKRMNKIVNNYYTNCTFIGANGNDLLYLHHKQDNEDIKMDSQYKKQKIDFFQSIYSICLKVFNLLEQKKIWNILIISFMALHSDSVPNEYVLTCSLGNCCINYCITTIDI